jgi:hypothetical protein
MSIQPTIIVAKSVTSGTPLPGTGHPKKVIASASEVVG